MKPTLILLISLLAPQTALHAAGAAEDTAALKNRFQDPPAEYRPLVFTHKSGQANLDWVKKLHAGGNMLYAHPTPGSSSKNELGETPVNSTYLNDPEEIRKARETAEKLHERGDGFWIYDELKIMKTLIFALCLLTSVASAQTPLSDGKTFTGWEGDTTTQWRIEDGAFTSGSLEKKQTRNDYLATIKEFGDFELTLKWKLQGTEGFVNGGVQFRSKRAPKGREVIGFQADLGAGYDGALYDNARRRTTLLRPSEEVLEKARKPLGEWNDFRIRAEGSRIQIWLNGVQTVDYIETDAAIATTGIIALQIHGNSTAIVRYKDIVITELPAAKGR